ncbi:MAG: DNA mismatch repair endonuclease MutL [Clostridiales bacterium]|nr:DNA mismatch repair endonuclease MutL [Clostridiales bacterium]
MGKINFLSDMLCNRIAAGEVIDRPYSAVKELIENSIDAGATEIEVSIERGGKDLIKVTDNGCGIEKDDMRAAFFSHATSKIKELEDIEHIRTLGFRGEALATIASISCVELVSAVEGEEGNKVECDGEFVGKVMPAVSPKGTSIVIRKFFFNTPVRYKFMKSDKKEETDITNYIIHYILGYPEIAFKYFVDGKLSLQSYGGGLDEAITQVYGANVLPNCFKIKAERNDIKLSGFISNQNYFKSNKTYQNVFLNGRRIDNYLISTAIYNAYSGYAMKRQYPFYVLNITVPDEMVDVNVHPNKSDVRFTNESVVYGSVYKIISSILDGTAKAAEFVVNDETGEKRGESASKPAPDMYSAQFISTEKVYDKDFSDVVGIEQFTKAKKAEPQKSERQPDLSAYENYEAPPAAADAERDLPLYQYFAPRAGVKIENTFTLRSDDGFDPILANIEAEKAEFKAKQQKLFFTQYSYKGTLFNTYLIYEAGDDAYLIDQHAAHERLIYDRLKAALNERKLTRQDMLVPYVLTVNPEEKRFLDENADLICQMGFSVEAFGESAFRVNSMPADLPSLNIKDFFEELLASIYELKKITLTEVLKDKIAQSACKHAVKGGEILTEQERDTLFEMLSGNLGLKCPHGRPICVKLSKSEIEKMFKRKV